MKTIVIIPARYKSSRFPGKPLVNLLGKPMVLWVAELSAKAVGQTNVYVATDDQRIADTVNQSGFKAVITSETCLTGTDRLAEVAKTIEADIYVNVQGDEPLLNPKDIRKIIEIKMKYPDEVINGYTLIGTNEDPFNINIPKVIFTQDDRMVYMSRLAIPGYKDVNNAPIRYYKQVCIYAFNRNELLSYRAHGKKSELEQSEDIEILRFLEWNHTIRMVKTESGSLAIDVPEDVPVVENMMKRDSLNFC